MSTKPILVLAFDIERSGGFSHHDTIALGASVVNDKMEELDRYFFNCYLKNETVFEKRCWDEFWSNHQDILKTLEYTGPKTKSELEHEMISGFQEFRKKWEKYAEDNDMILALVSDNNVYDGGFVNELICKYLSDTYMPIPYSAYRKEYNPFYETHSQQVGLLYATDPSHKSYWGVTKRIRELYSNIPECKKFHDHNPANDAYTIAFDQQVLFGIRNGIYVLKTN